MINIHVRRFLTWLSFHSLHLRVMLGVVVPLVIVIGTISYIDYTRRQDYIFETLSMFSSHIGQVIQNDLRHQMLKSDFEGLQELLITVGDLNEVEAVYLLNTGGEVIFASDESVIGSTMDNRQPECTACHDFEVPERPLHAVVDLPNGARVFRSAQIIDNEEICQRCHEENSAHLGLLLTDLSVSPYEETLLSDLRDHFLWWSAALLITLGLVGLVFNRFVLQRLNGLSRQLAFVGEGQRAARLPDRPRDEIGRIAAAFNKMARQVEEREQDNELLSTSLRQQSEQRGQLLNRLITAQEQERKRVARDLHDELGQALFGLSLRASALKRRAAAENTGAVEQIDELERLIQETSEKMYDMILDLRPSALDDLGLLPAIRGHAERVCGPAGIQFAIRIEGSVGRLAPELETTLYRTFQEALNNVVRHAGADLVDIQFRRENGVLEGVITDNGEGFDLDSIDLSGYSQRGLGLLGMRERISQSGGEFEILTGKGRGTSIKIRMGLDGAHEE